MATGFPIIFGSRSRAWTPSLIATQLWLDGNDRSTITLNGLTVSQWNDKSGNGRHLAQATAANQPTLAVGRNLVLWSEQFQQGTWPKERVTITTNATLSPIGDQTADKFIPTSAAGSHVIYNNPPTETTAGVSTWTIRAKASEYNFVTLCAVYINRYSATFDLTTGAVTKTATFGTPTNTSTSAKSLGNGWWELSVSMTAGTGASTLMTIGASASGTPTQDTTFLNVTDAGDNVSGIFIWGAQLNPGTTADIYQQTTSSTQSLAIGLNGKPALAFNGSTQFMTGVSNIDISGDPLFSIAGVFATPLPTGNVFISWGSQTTASGYNYMGANSGNNVWTGFSGNNQTGTATLSAPSSAHVLSIIRNATNTSNWTITQNGNNVSTAQGNSTAITLANGPLNIGRWVGGGVTAMTASEMIVIQSTLSSDDRQRIEGYLAWKWGLESNLPANHPYKLFPPTV